MSIAIAGNSSHTYVVNPGVHLHRGKVSALSAPKSVKRHGGTIRKRQHGEGNVTMRATFAPDMTPMERQQETDRVMACKSEVEDFFDSRSNRDMRAIMQTNRAPFLAA